MRPEDLLRYVRDVCDRLELTYMVVGSTAIQGNRLDRDYLSRWARDLEVDEIWDAIVKKEGERKS